MVISKLGMLMKGKMLSHLLKCNRDIGMQTPDGQIFIIDRFQNVFKMAQGKIFVLFL